jgi:hypothetical protein
MVGTEQTAYAHTCVPVSGMIVKRTLSSSRRTHATLPNDEREAVSSDLISHYRLTTDEVLRENLLEKVLMFLTDVLNRIVKVQDDAAAGKMWETRRA